MSEIFENINADFSNSPEWTNKYKESVGIPLPWQELQRVQYAWVAMRRWEEDLIEYSARQGQLFT